MGEPTLAENAADSSTGRPSAARSRPQMLGKYRIDSRIGKGGMGVVYQAEDTLLQRHVAIKVLPRILSADPVVFQRFMLEARAVARLSHPNIVLLYDINEIQGGWYLVMELVAGGSAQDRLRRDGPFAWPVALRIVADACRGLVAAHDQNLIHRDIKPANILLAADGVAKLADFGLAKSIDAEQPGPTSPDTILGTPAFMSPEQCRALPIDPRSDLYSLGATLYTLLTRQAPFEAASSIEVLYAHCNAARPDPRRVKPNIPAEVVALIQVAMSVSPDDRFASAREMLGVIERLMPSSESTPVIEMGEVPVALPVVRPTQADVATTVMPAAQRKSGPRKKPAPKLPTRRWLLGGLLATAGLGGIAMLLSRRTPEPERGRSNQPFWMRADAGGLALSPAVEGSVQAVAISPDQRWVAAITDARRLYLWDLITGQPHSTLGNSQVQTQPLGLVFSRDGKTLITGITNKLLHLTLTSGKVTEVTPSGGPQRNHTIACLALAPDGTSLLLSRTATVGWSGSELVLASALGATRTAQVGGYAAGSFQSAAFSPDGREILTLGSDGSLRAWDARTLTAISKRQEKLNRGSTHALAITPNDGPANKPPGAYAMVADDTGLLYCRLDDWSKDRGTIKIDATPYAVAFSADSRFWAAGLASGRIVLRNNTTQAMFELPGHDKAVRTLAFGSEGTGLLVSGGDDGRVRLWSVG